MRRTATSMGVSGTTASGTWIGMRTGTGIAKETATESGIAIGNGTGIGMATESGIGIGTEEIAPTPRNITGEARETRGAAGTGTRPTKGQPRVKAKVAGMWCT